MNNLFGGIASGGPLSARGPAIGGEQKGPQGPSTARSLQDAVRIAEASHRRLRTSSMGTFLPDRAGPPNKTQQIDTGGRRGRPYRGLRRLSD